MINKIHLIFCVCLLPFLVYGQFFTINLDLPANQRYTQLAKTKKDSIASFISYLKTNVQKYKIAFKLADQLNTLAPLWLKNKVGTEFYEECQSISIGAGIPLSDIIVFNYMYELGAATDFCTAITISTDTVRLLGRNLDYGYQQYLASNSVHIKYQSKGIVLFQTLGHAGFVGTHTAFRRATDQNPNQYGITLNERSQGGLHLTLQKMMVSNCETSPYALMKTLKYCKGDIDTVIKHLDNFDTCAAVYYTVIDQQGRSRVIQKNRGIGSHLIRTSTQLDSVQYIVQTNHDGDVSDPDGRSITAQTKLRAAIQKGEANSTAIWKILTQSPNFNELTLMSGIIDVYKGQIFHQVWGNN